MTMLESAKLYVQRGASVMPVGRNKIPCLKEWKFLQERIPTIEELEEWWAEYPNANIGIITGKVSGLTVVDVEKGGRTDIFPTTDTVRTGGGGFHFYYSYYPDYGNKARILPLTDIRGNGGYVVAPPSIHENGNRYELSVRAGRSPFPIHLFGGGLSAKKIDWKDIMTGVSQGGRNQTAVQVIGKLLHTFAPDDWESVAYPMILDWNEKNNPPLAESELKQSFISISKREMEKRNPERIAENKPLSFTEVVSLGLEELNATRPEDIVSFGYKWLDDALTGIFKGELVVVGGETGTGKTTFTTNIALRASVKHKVMIFALEDRLADYGIKAVYYEIGKLRKKENLKNYPWNAYRRNEINDLKYSLWQNQAKENLKNENLLFENSPELIDLEILEKIIEKRTNEGVALFVIDNLHIFDLLKGNSTKADYIEKMMVRLKKLQTRTGARIILIAHYKKLEGKKPAIDSFKDAMSISQNANYVINLWRDRREGAVREDTTVMIPKTRNPNGEATINARFNPDINDLEFIDLNFGTEGEQPSSVSEIKFDETKVKDYMQTKF